MLDLNSILQNDAVKGILEKAGIGKGQEKDVASTAMEAVKGVMSKDPMKLASLFSANQDTDDDKKVEGEIMQNFSSGLQSKGFSMDKVGALTSMLPLLMNMFKGEAKGAKGGGMDLASIVGMLGGMFGGDQGGKKKKGGFDIGALIGRFFGKK